MRSNFVFIFFLCKSSKTSVKRHRFVHLIEYYFSSKTSQKPAFMVIKKMMQLASTKINICIISGFCLYRAPKVDHKMCLCLLFRRNKPKSIATTLRLTHNCGYSLGFGLQKAKSARRVTECAAKYDCEIISPKSQPKKAEVDHLMCCSNSFLLKNCDVQNSLFRSCLR